MLPQSLRQSYQNFFSALDQLDSTLESDDPKLLQLTLPNLQEVFPALEQGLNAAQSENALDEAIASRLQSIHTEINKQLRLLSTDIAFLKTAKQPDTQQQRRQQIGDRIQSLRQYGDAVLALGETSPKAAESDA